MPLLNTIILLRIRQILSTIVRIQINYSSIRTRFTFRYEMFENIENKSGFCDNKYTTQ